MKLYKIKYGNCAGIIGIKVKEKTFGIQKYIQIYGLGTSCRGCKMSIMENEKGTCGWTPGNLELIKK